ncbi:MAG: hypothetical protein JWM21_1364 [Acidobacteria bacterium]|nr:hypothetical protein [Acidobacteriota bacterium]
MNIEILEQARDDLVEGFEFYEQQRTGLGSYFLSNLYGDIESLHLYCGLHETAFSDYFRLLSRRFPFAVYYTVEEDVVSIHAVIDCRRDPAWTRNRLA